MEDIICKNCGGVNDYTTEMKSGQNVATCKACGSFIKNIPYAKPTLWFGKFKGKPIEDFDGKEIEYLYWVRNNPDIWQKLNRRTAEAILMRLDGHL